MIAGSLGDIVFEVSSSRVLLLESFSCSLESRWEEHEAQGALPRPEFLGPALPTHSLAILLRRDFLGHSPVVEIRKLQVMLARGEIARLIIGHVGYGKVSLRKLEYTWNHVSRGEAGPLSASANLELKEYV